MRNLRGGSTSESRPDAEALRRDLDALLERMQGPAAREAVEALFRATATELAVAAGSEARRRQVEEPGV